MNSHFKKALKFLFLAFLAHPVSAEEPGKLRASNTQDISPKSKEMALSTEGALLVNYLYTYGGPAVAKNPHIANPGNKCIPGIRAYTEDVKSTSRGDSITNTDFAAHINAKYGYGHPKISTLVLRLRDDEKVEFFFMECKDSDNKDYYEWEWWPHWSNSASMINHIHSLDTKYEPRLKEVPDSIKGPLLDYTRVSWCNGYLSMKEINECLEKYEKELGFGSGMKAFAWMDHRTDWSNDDDVVYVAKNDDPNYRKCIISFQQSAGLADLSSFLWGNEFTTGYCGRYGVHIGVRNELWKITHDPQYAENIKPALETCDEVTCVGYSLGGAICNAFVMCANTGPEYLDSSSNAGMWDDYHSLVWSKKGSKKEVSVADEEGSIVEFE